MAQPDLILTPFGANAPAGNIDVIPETLAPSDPPEKASWQRGFPPVTMIPLAAGGIPPRGQDFNGVLNAISEHTVFQGGGGQYKWDDAYVAANGGYPKDAVLQSDDGSAAYVSLIDNNSVNFNTDPAAIGVSWGEYTGAWSAPTVSQEEAEAGVSTERRAWTALRVFQALRGAAAKSIFVDAVRPVGSHYIQFAETDGTFASAKSPSTLFGGTWSLKFNTESVFFRTEGALAAEGRTAGVQQDAFQGHWHDQWYSGTSTASSPGSAALIGVTSDNTVKASSNNSIRNAQSDGINGTPRTTNETRPRNRLIRVWERTA